MPNEKNTRLSERGRESERESECERETDREAETELDREREAVLNWQHVKTYSLCVYSSIDLVCHMNSKCSAVRPGQYQVEE